MIKVNYHCSKLFAKRHSKLSFPVCLTKLIIGYSVFLGVSIFISLLYKRQSWVAPHLNYHPKEMKKKKPIRLNAWILHCKTIVRLSVCNKFIAACHADQLFPRTWTWKYHRNEIERRNPRFIFKKKINNEKKREKMKWKERIRKCTSAKR